MHRRNQFFSRIQWWHWALATAAAAGNALLIVWLIWRYRYFLIFCLVAGVSGLKKR